MAAHTPVSSTMFWMTHWVYCHWLPAFHCNGPPANPFIHPTSLASPLGGHTLFGQASHSGPKPYFIRSTSWVTRCAPGEAEVWTPICSSAQKLLNNLSKLSICVAQWMNFRWSTKYSKSTSILLAFIPKANPRLPGTGLPRTSWFKLNRLRTDVKCFYSSMYK